MPARSFFTSAISLSLVSRSRSSSISNMYFEFRTQRTGQGLRLFVQQPLLGRSGQPRSPDLERYHSIPATSRPVRNLGHTRFPVVLGRSIKRALDTIFCVQTYD